MNNEDINDTDEIDYQEFLDWWEDNYRIEYPNENEFLEDWEFESLT